MANYIIREHFPIISCHFIINHLYKMSINDVRTVPISTSQLCTPSFGPLLSWALELQPHLALMLIQPCVCVCVCIIQDCSQSGLFLYKVSGDDVQYTCFHSNSGYVCVICRYVLVTGGPVFTEEMWRLSCCALQNAFSATLEPVKVCMSNIL